MCLSLSLCVQSGSSRIYKVIRADGSAVYTDKPTGGATEFKLKGKANIAAPLASPPAPQHSKAVNSQTTQPAKITLLIDSPADQATVRSNEGNVTVSGSAAPFVTGNYELYVNGQLKQRSGTPIFQLSGLDRGQYQIQIRLRDQTGKQLALSPVSTFYLQKVSALLRPN